VSNVKSIYGAEVPVKELGEPNVALVALLKDILAMAESGQLQSFIGTGFTTDNLRTAVWADQHPDVYQMLGALGWLQAEYIARHAE
jgi:hypothetical protein